MRMTPLAPAHWSPAQVDRALKFLIKNQLLAPKAADTAAGPLVIVYRITDRGTAFTEVFSAFFIAVSRRLAPLGPRAEGDVRACTQ
jgi:DNA-binding PadR family transcriptional regulator